MTNLLFKFFFYNLSSMLSLVYNCLMLINGMKNFSKRKNKSSRSITLEQQHVQLASVLSLVNNCLMLINGMNHFSKRKNKKLQKHNVRATACETKQSREIDKCNASYFYSVKVARLEQSVYIKMIALKMKPHHEASC